MDALVTGSTQHIDEGSTVAVVYRDIVDGVKEKRCYLSLAYDTELTSTAETCTDADADPLCLFSGTAGC